MSSKKMFPTEEEREVLLVLQPVGTCYTRGALAQELGISEREVRRRISALNAKGFPVVSAGGGFKWITPKEGEWLQSAARSLRSQAKSLTKRARRLETMYADMFQKPLAA